MPHFVFSRMQIHLCNNHSCFQSSQCSPSISYPGCTDFLLARVSCALQWVCVLGEREWVEWQPRLPLKPFKVVQAVPSPTAWFKLGLLCERTLMRREAESGPECAAPRGREACGNEPYKSCQQAGLSSWTTGCLVLHIAEEQQFEWSHTIDLLLFPDKWACPLLALLIVSKGKAQLM